MKKVVILALNNAVATTVTIPMDVFHQTGLLWNRARGLSPTPYFNVKVVTTDGKPIRCLNGIYIHPHQAMNEVDAADLIVIAAISDIDKVMETHGDAIDWLLYRYGSGAHIASVCTGAFFLAETGLLDGKTATTHWGFADQFRARYPLVLLQPERLITDEGDLFCSGAFNSCIDLSVYLVEKYCGREVAVQCSKALIHDLGRRSQTPYAIMNFQKNHGDEMILAAQLWIEENYSQCISIDIFLEKIGMSRRTFERRFKSATGDTPLYYLQRIRVEAAKRLLESGNQTFDEITYHVGYEEASFFRKVFKKHTGLRPKEYQKKFL